jgi:hypothetical protein
MNAFCLKCKHYFVTHNPSSPRGCKKFAMQSSKFPSQIVREQSGKECMAYEQKTKARPLDHKEKALS